MAKPKYKYIMDYIDGKDVFKAVMFASKMIRQGKNPSQAIRIASSYYDVDMNDVAHYTGQRGSRKAHENR